VGGRVLSQSSFWLLARWCGLTAFILIGTSIALLRLKRSQP